MSPRIKVIQVQSLELDRLTRKAKMYIRAISEMSLILSQTSPGFYMSAGQVY